MSLITSIVTGGSNNHATSSEEAQGLRTDMFSAGPVGAISLNAGSGGSGAFAVSAEASPNMNVRVLNGIAYVTGTPTGGDSQLFRVNMNAYQDVAIASNASGSTRYDWVYIALGAAQLANPAVDASDVATLVVSRSTSSTSDNGTPPAYGLNLAIVTVANGAVSITNSNITDTRVQSGTTLQPVAWSTWTPSYTGFSAAPTAIVGRYQQVGKIVFASLTATAGTSNATTFTFTLPVAPKVSQQIMLAQVSDNSSAAAAVGMIVLSAGSLTATVYKDGASTPWTGSGTKNVQFGALTYESV